MTQEDKMTLPNDMLLADVVSLLSSGHTVTLRAKGDSMFPFIVGGRDCVVLQRSRSVRVDDIVLARLPGRRYVLHRVYGTAGDTFVLMGDGNVCGTELCRAEDVCGTVLKIIRDGRYVVCRSPQEMRRVRLWKGLLPVRRYILALCRRWRRWRRGKGNKGK